LAAVSCHYTVRSSDGLVIRLVHDKDIALHSGNWRYNQTSIGIEHEGFVEDPTSFTDAMYQSSAKLTAYLAYKYAIPADRRHVIGHDEVPNPNQPGRYGGASGHQDPGPYFDWDQYMNYVRMYLPPRTASIELGQQKGVIMRVRHIRSLIASMQMGVWRRSISSVQRGGNPPDILRDRALERLAKCYENITSAQPGIYGVVLWDPTSNHTVSLNAKKRFFGASIGKLATLLTLYRAAARSEVNLDEEITIFHSDIQSYGSGVLHKFPVGTSLTLRRCAQHLIKESDNTAWAMLNRYLGMERVQVQLGLIGAHSTDYFHNITSPNDVLRLLQKISDPRFTSPEFSSEMLSFMTDTAFEDRLPAGLPQGVRVAHKIGTYGTSFGDAGIVFNEDSDGSNGHYFLVVLSTATDEEAARMVMRKISLATYRAIVDPTAQPRDRHTSLA